jgi:hypothetical protein
MYARDTALIATVSISGNATLIQYSREDLA